MYFAVANESSSGGSTVEIPKAEGAVYKIHKYVRKTHANNGMYIPHEPDRANCPSEEITTS